MKKKILISVGVALASFALSIVGSYFALPRLAPEVVRAVRGDSLQADTPGGDIAANEAKTTQMASIVPAASEALGSAPNDSMAITKAALKDSTGQALADSVLKKRVLEQRRLVQALTDSLETLRMQLVTSQDSARVRREQNGRLARRLVALEDQQARASDVSSSLTKLEIREMKAILSNLNVGVLRQLYDRASGRNRARLLRAMPARRAAQFVRGLVQTEGTPSREVSTERTATDAGSSETVAAETTPPTASSVPGS